MRESDVPPPGDPSMRGSRIFGLLVVAVIVVFIAWFAAENWISRRPSQTPVGPQPGVGGQR